MKANGRSGRQKTSNVQKNVEMLRQLVKSDRRLSARKKDLDPRI